MKGLTEEEIRAAYDSEEGILWVDISETKPEDGEFMTRVFES